MDAQKANQIGTGSWKLPVFFYRGKLFIYTDILQVRKQSDDIAKRLRQRVSVEQEQRRIEKEHELERKLTLWKMKRLKDLEQLYRNAITEIGTGHQMAMEEVFVATSFLNH